MFCPQCGQPCAEGMRFCEHCGAPLQQAAPQAGYVPNVPPETAAATPVQSMLRTLATSPLYLTGAIAYSCMILFSLLSTALDSGGMMGLVDQYLSLSLQYGGIGQAGEAMEELGRVLPILRGASFGTALLVQIPAILIAVGIWLVFATARDRSGMPMKTTGLTIIKVLAIIQLVLVSLLALLLIGVLLIAMAALASYEDAAVPIFLVSIVLVAAIFALLILYYVKLITTLTTLSDSIRDGIVSDRISVYLAVMTILGGVVSVISLLGARGLFAGLSVLGGAVASFSYGIFLFRCRSQLQAARCQAAGLQPPYGAPAPRPAPEPTPVPQPVYTAPQPAPQSAPPAQSAQQPVSVAPATMAIPTSPSVVVPETTVLNAKPMQPTLLLTHLRDGNTVPISQPRFRIGRDPAVVDYIINDNTAVGRQHADLLLHDGGCYVVDLNSTNHTYLNGTPLNPGTEYPLQDGDELILGDEAFRIGLS